jgi:hypothetical protein
MGGLSKGRLFDEGLNGDMENASYGTVKGKTAEEILATADCSYPGPIGEYLRVAAQIRTNQELISALSKASADGGNLQSRIILLTIVLAVAAVLQFLATDWQNLVWACTHWILRQ